MKNFFLYSRTQFWFDLKAGGSVGHTAGVVRGLSQLGEVTIVSNDHLYGLEHLHQNILKPWFKKPYALGEIVYNVPYFSYLIEKANATKPALIYHRYSRLSFATSRAAQKLKIPLIIEYNGSEQWISKYWSEKNIKQKIFYPVLSKIYGLIEKYNLECATLIIVVSEVSKDLLIDMGIPPSKVFVNANGVDPDQFCIKKEGEIDELKFQLGVPKGKVIVGFSGTFGEWHGIPELADAIGYINEDPIYRKKIFFILFGDGKLRQMIQQKVGHYENVRFTGTVPYENMANHLSVCDILLSPHGKTLDGKRFFGSPTKLFEYMSMGKGIIASNLDQLGEVISHGVNGWLVEPGNVPSLVQGVKTLVDDPYLREQLGQAARKEALAKYTWAAHAQRTLEALYKVLSKA